ncbi:MAG TPA: DUF488 domain-containing protein [Allosphingosinicella sp.]|jgi:uncharacterized protein (DUF488 family)
MPALYTIGYEGASVPDFLATLKLAGVEHVLDVRELPQSRRPGFSKNALTAALSDAEVTYSHLRQLGDPKPGRDAARSGNIVEFTRIFEAHLALPETQQALYQAVDIATKKVTALLCFERDPRTCHRTLVARAINELCSLNVRNLGVARNAGQCSRSVRQAA